MQAKEKVPLRTAVYIDGYNLYYGRLRGTPYKWLDVVQLFETHLKHRDQNEELERVFLFTANALASFASNGQQSTDAQQSYHRALKFLHEDRIEIVYGKHTYDKNGTLLPAFIEGQPFDRKNRVRVWKLEEKKTDVNLAIRMYSDASKGFYDRIILVSNDSDAEPALEAIRKDFPHIMIGVVMPIHPPAAEAEPTRRVSGSLVNQSNWVMENLKDEQLSSAQLPERIPTKKKPIRKPLHW